MRALCLGGLLLVAVPAAARDLGQWDDTDPGVRAWYARQMQPDHPTVSCCGPADGYWADKQEIETRPDGSTQVYAIVTDDRDDAALRRPHVDIGTRIPIPPEKITDPRPDPNPTGHGVVFLSSARFVFCYFNPPGDG